MENATFVFAPDAWAWLMHAVHASDTGPLPMENPPDLELGERIIKDSGYVILTDQEAMIEPTLLRVTQALARAYWQALACIDDRKIRFVAGGDMILILERTKSGLISITPTQTLAHGCEMIAEESGNALWEIEWLQDEAADASVPSTTAARILECSRKGMETHGKGYC